MTIHLATGLPGSGKTLWTIQHVKELSEREQRTVYYYGIPDLRLPWVELDDATKWPDLPRGAIIVIDEAQRVFRLRSSASQVPRHVSELETHRHLGHDLFLITQHPKLIDANVRNLTQIHWHIMRKFGLELATVHEFAECRENPAFRSGSMEKQWKYPSELYDVYQSAQLHTVRRRIPARIWFLFLAPVILAFVGWYLYSHWTKVINDKKTKPGETQTLTSKDAVPAPAQNGLIPTSAVVGKGPDPSMQTAAERRRSWLDARVPAVPELAFTAPAYADVVKPVSAPVPAICGVYHGDCKCYTHQGTRLPTVSDNLCRQIVENGFFADWQRDGSSQGGGTAERERRPAPAPLADAGPSSGASSSSPPVGVIPFAGPRVSDHKYKTDELGIIDNGPPPAPRVRRSAAPSIPAQ